MARSRLVFYYSTCKFDNADAYFTLQIKFTDDDDPTYGTHESRPAMIAHGKICFRTCYQRAALPWSYIIRLAEQVYPTADYKDFESAFTQWLICEILNAIGNHTIA